MLSCLQGYSVCIFTYGQTGTGKTYSMEVGWSLHLGVGRDSGLCMRVQCGTAHCPQGPPEDPGIAPRALQLLFREMGTGGHHHVTLSMVEIYNETVRSGMRGRLSPCPWPRVLQPPLKPIELNPPSLTRDLLATGPPERLVVRQGPAGQGGIQVAGLTHWDVPNLETLHQVKLPSRAPVFFHLGAGTIYIYIRLALMLCSPDAESGEKQPSYSSHCYEPAQLTFPCPSYADFTGSISSSGPGYHRYHWLCLSPAEFPAHKRLPSTPGSFALQAHCTWWIWQDLNECGKQGWPARYRETRMAPGVCVKPRQSTAPCWHWEE